MQEYVTSETKRLKKLKKFFWDSINENNRFTVGKWAIYSLLQI